MRRVMIILAMLQLNVLGREIVNEGFESERWAGGIGWVENSVEVSSTYFYDGTRSLKFNSASDYITSPELNIKTLKLKFLPTNSSVTLKSQFSSDGTDFTILTPVTVTGTEDKFNDLSITAPVGTKYVKFSKVGSGNIYLDSLKIDDGLSVIDTVSMESHNLKYGTSNNVIYALRVLNTSLESNNLQSLKFTTGGYFRISDLANIAFKFYKSDDSYFSGNDQLLGMFNAIDTVNEVFFPNLNLLIPADSEVYIIVTLDLGEDPKNVQGDYNISLISPEATFSNDSIFYKDLSNGVSFSFWSLFSFSREFDWQRLSDDTAWFGDTASFSIATAPESGNGSVNYQNECLVSSSLGGDKVLAVNSSIAYGTWEFLVADGLGWSVSSQNNFSYILVSDVTDVEKMREDTKNYNGYSLLYDGSFKLCRQDGTETVVLLDTNFPEGGDNANKNSGYNVKVERFNAGQWQVYIDEGGTEMETLRGTVTDNNYIKSSAMAVTSEISNPSDARVFYVDNISVNESFQNYVVTASYETLFYKEELEESTILNWSVSADKNVESYEVWYLKGKAWHLAYTVSGGDSEYGFEANFFADDWMLKVNIAGELEAVTTTAMDKNQINCTLILEEGWNLVGLSNRYELLQKIKQKGYDDFWVWRDNSYKLTDDVNELDAFWVYSTERNVIDFVTLEQRFYEPEFSVGWNMISLNSIPDDQFTTSEFFSYYDGTYDSCNCQQISLFNGYWLFHTN